MAVCLLTITAHAQYGGILRGQKNNGLYGPIMADSVALKTSDSITHEQLKKLDSLTLVPTIDATNIYGQIYNTLILSAWNDNEGSQQQLHTDAYGRLATVDEINSPSLPIMRFKLDSIYSRMYTDSVNLDGINQSLGLGGVTYSKIDEIAQYTSNINDSLYEIGHYLKHIDSLTLPIYNTLETNIKADLNHMKLATDSIKSNANLAQGSTTSGQGGQLSMAAVTTSAPAYTTGQTSPLSLTTKGGLRSTLVDGSGTTITITGSSLNVNTTNATATYDSTWTAVQMDTAGLGAMANSATVGWQSDSVGLRQWKCTDVKIGVKISMANTAPANDKAVYVYAYPIWYDGSTWYFGSGGTATYPSGANSTYTIASPNNLRLLGVLSYTTQNMVLQDQFMLSNAFGQTMPDAFGLVLIDYSGAALHTTNHRIYYSLVNKTQR